MIIDCGGTTAKIALIGAEVSYHRLRGFNPNYHDWDAFKKDLTELLKTLPVELTQVTYYGTGIHNSQRVSKMTSLIHGATGVPRQDIQVFSDLLACAHAAYAEEPVVVGILGTGSNVGFFDGHSLNRRTPSLGYLLGDEGSGIDIGKRLLLAYFYQQLPVELEEQLTTEYDLSLDHIIDITYNQHALRPLLSELTKVAHDNIELSPVEAIVRKGLGAFIENRLGPEFEYHPDASGPHLFGSVAFVFDEILQDEMNKRLNRTCLITRDPLQLLVEKR